MHISIRTFLYIHFLLYHVSFLFGMDQATQNQESETSENKALIFLGKTTIPTDIQKEVTNYCFNGPNANLASQLFVEKYGDSSNKQAIVLGTLFSNTSNASDISDIFILQNIQQKNALERINKTINYYPIFKQLSPEKQDKIIDFLYVQKYTSPLWKEVENAQHNPKKYLATTVNTWSKEDPAASLYAQLIPNEDKSSLKLTYPYFFEYFSEEFNVNQGIYIESYHNGQVSITKSTHGKTELPFIVALDHATNSCIFKCPIHKIHDVDVEALKNINYQPINLIFHESLEDVTIPPALQTIGNISLICMDKAPNIPPFFDKAQKVNVPTQDTIVDKQMYNQTYISYCIFDPYWRLKALGKISLFVGTWYLIKKCLWDELGSFNIQKNNLIEKAKINTFNAEIKPQLTPEIQTALHIHAGYQSSPLPDLLSENIGTLSPHIPVTALSFDSARTIIAQTNGLLSREFPIDHGLIKTPLNVRDMVGDCTIKNGSITSIVAAETGILGSIYRFFAGPDNIVKKRIPRMQKREKFGTIMGFYVKMMLAPIWIIDSVMALGCSIFKPEWLAHYEQPQFRVIVPKEHDPHLLKDNQDPSNE